MAVFHDSKQAWFASGCKPLISLVSPTAPVSSMSITILTVPSIPSCFTIVTIRLTTSSKGGIRSKNIAKNYFDLGADYLIIGSFAISNSDEVKNLTNNYPEKIYVALDILNNKIMINGWVEESDFTPVKLYKTYEKSKIRGYILTDIEKDGMLTGLNQEMILQNIPLTNKKLIVGGGLKNNNDLEKLRMIKSNNLEGVIAGKSFYVGNINLKEAQKILDINA